MDEATKLGFEFAKELTFQLITLSTAVVALTITFIKEVLGGLSASAASRIQVAWACYIVSIIAGIWTAMALTGTLLSESTVKTIEFNVQLPAVIQILAFLLGTSFMIRGASKALRDQA
jgi:hypothetical protein